MSPPTIISMPEYGDMLHTVSKAYLLCKEALKHYKRALREEHHAEALEQQVGRVGRVIGLQHLHRKRHDLMRTAYDFADEGTLALVEAFLLFPASCLLRQIGRAHV